ncbi:39S ribosomal protein L28, mitochondrial [Toxorhynchites rutilus septentrionalis]|uniref:39S ribosomal protein L28, mitochondrial n=1 Tax=Toxorhynchites rutilus septentrionalis TaxID=329112 RepID=UPI0024794329|nr:39S ribosomal protein L28, mitochondrial [Toxorhynchites rutilus septentrionalis]
MASATPQGASLLYGLRKSKKFTKGLGAQLPAAYKKFWDEWKIQQPAAVHYVPKNGMFQREDLTGLVTPIQNVPLPLIDPPESHEGIWGGEAIIKGFQKRNQYKRRVPHFWVPVLRRSVVHSRVLNEYMAVTVTDRTLDLIHDNHGFDHYLLKTPACDLRSMLAIKLKKKILVDLLAGCPKLADNPEKQKEIVKEFSCYLAQYTSEEVDWYGLTYVEAILKVKQQIESSEDKRPHKIIFREKLIEQLKEAGIKEAQGSVNELKSIDGSSSSWLSKLTFKPKNW